MVTLPYDGCQVWPLILCQESGRARWCRLADLECGVVLGWHDPFTAFAPLPIVLLKIETVVPED